jgi:hypothetical protein
MFQQGADGEVSKSRGVARFILLQLLARTLEEYLVKTAYQPCVPKYRVVVQPLGGVVCLAA